MGKYSEIRQDFLEERTRILQALAEDENQHIILRLIGALAFRTHCPEYGYLQEALGRVFTDIDFASYHRFYKDIQRLLAELGYEEDKTVSRLFGEHRMLFHDLAFGRHIDVFFDELHFCHTLPLVGRLEAEALTLPLAELLIEKMQIVQINGKDQIDAIMLLREHPIGEKDEKTINSTIITGLTSSNWGLWRTVTGNLALLKEFLPKYSQLAEEDRRVVGERIDQLRERIDTAPKRVQWKVRARIGERVKWYEDVEELTDR